MYARLVRFTGDGTARPAAQALADELAPAIAEQPGCLGVSVFGDDSEEYGVFVLWDSQEHAAAAAAIIRPQLDTHLNGHVTGPPDARLFQVLSEEKLALLGS